MAPGNTLLKKMILLLGNIDLPILEFVFKETYTNNNFKRKPFLVKIS